MKKAKLLRIVLSLALVFTLVFAGSGSTFAAETTSGSNVIDAVNANSTSVTPDLAYLQYSSSASAKQEIKTPKAGTIAVRFTATAPTYAYLYDAKGNQIYGYSTSVPASSSDTDYKYAYFPVTAAGTYTLELKAATYGGSAEALIDAFYYPTSGTLTKGKTYYGSSPDGKVSYYKVTATSTGYFTVDFPAGYNDPASYQVKLMSSSKKAIFKKGYEYVNSSKSYKTRIGVTKGTYYLAVKTTDPYYGINVKFTSVKENSGSTKGKAKSLSKGNTKRGIITASQSSTSGDWYKFTIKKAQKVKIEVSTLTSQGGGNGGLKVSFYQGKNSYSSFTENFNYYNDSDTITLYTVGSSKLAAGTYYMKVQKYNDGNGYYKIKWQ